ncbi:hypothetical protein ACFPYJ_14410 [Paenibacillus solisilvae]|uniref:DUF2642 domain-containing protein n=1 Tax=Paenibacillus solisilvae TaxID=2486751 RepID=A0ABW0VXF4_9BACL
MFNPNTNQSQSAPSVQQKAMNLIGRQVGLSLKNGQGVSGVLCSVQGGQVFLIQYLYAAQFATFHYAFNDIADILPFPACQTG